MLPYRPDLEYYSELLDNLVIAKDELNKLEYIQEKTVAIFIKIAMANGAKTKALDYVKVIGNTDEDKKEITEIKEAIIEAKKELSRLYSKIKAWEMSKDLYVSDSYHQVKGRGSGFAKDENSQ